MTHRQPKRRKEKKKKNRFYNTLKLKRLHTYEIFENYSNWMCFITMCTLISTNNMHISKNIKLFHDKYLRIKLLIMSRNK